MHESKHACVVNPAVQFTHVPSTGHASKSHMQARVTCKAADTVTISVHRKQGSDHSTNMSLGTHCDFYVLSADCCGAT